LTRTTASNSTNTSGAPKIKPLIVIVGETASGKSALAMKLAQEFEGELICADSRTVYKGMDIGTAKPSPAEQAKVRHHLLDIVEPNQDFTVADFKRLALKTIGHIRRRGKLPIMIGGTGLYVDAVVFDYSFRAKYNDKIRRELARKSLVELQALVATAGFTTLSNGSNHRQLVRVLESGQLPEDNRSAMIDNVVIIGLSLPRAELRRRLKARVELMFKQGLRREVERLVKTYGWEHEALTGIGYREFEGYYLRETSMAEVKRNIFQHSLNYAKRQRTWFKRNPAIVWFKDADLVGAYIRDKLDKIV